ncbi:MAG: PEP-CTERM sorting domain-containing protein [Leptospirales bacterium]
MKKMNRMKKAALAASLSLALAVGVSANATSAWAGYLSAPTQVPSGTTGSFPATYQTTTGDSFNLSYVGTSSYGNTIPNVSTVPVPAGTTGSINSITDHNLPNSDLFYNGSTLNLTMVATTGPENYSASGTTGSFSGQVISNVFKVGAGSTMPGATPGNLVFTYQFDVLANNASSVNVNQATVALFNNPGGSRLYNLGAGVNVNSSGGVSPLGPTLCPTCTVASLNNLTGLVYTNPANETIGSLSDQFASGFTAGYVSPQIFVASNADYFGLGSLSVSGTGLGGSANVFVPNTPEPSTLILLGSGLALLSFLVLRKKENQLVI